jgi:hypothetical protein
MDRVRAETYPDGTSVHYTYTSRGLLDRVGGSAPDSSWLFYNRTFVDDIGYDEFGQRSSPSTGQSGENQVETSYCYDDRRRLTSLTSTLDPGGESRTLIVNTYENWVCQTNTCSNTTNQESPPGGESKCSYLGDQIMKAAEKKKVITKICSVVPNLANYGHMAIEEPRNRILRGIFLEDSSDKRKCYAWKFVKPLFEPPPFVMSFTLGERLGSGTRTWTIDDSSELAEIAAQEGVGFWAPASTPASLAAWPYLISKTSPYAIRVRALALILCRNWSGAIEELRRIVQKLSGGTGWTAQMNDHTQALIGLVEDDPEAAYLELSHWEEENARQLRLPPE